MQKYGIYVLLFFSVFSGSYHLISYIQEKSLISEISRQVLQKMSKSEQQRTAKEKERKLLEGNRKKQSLVYKIDKILLQSGIRRIIPVLNTELLISLLLFSVFGTELYLGIRNAEIIFLILVPLILPSAVYSLLVILRDRNYQKTEEQLLSFMNLIGNYQQSCDDLISILGKISPYLEEPLKSAVEECYLYAKVTGNFSAAFYELELRIPHEQFQRLVKNLEICYRHDANYGEIIGDCREMLHEYLKNKRERQAMKNNARIEVLLIVLCCLFAFWMTDGFMKQSLWVLLTKTTVGKGLLVYCAMILMLCGRMLLSADR
ncbi:MAG: type II secretion system F family protein [Lachnospiraceae bacterium]